jgi:hypothetical protein
LELGGTAFDWGAFVAWGLWVARTGPLAMHCEVRIRPSCLQTRPLYHTILQVSRYKRHAHRAFKSTEHNTLTLHTRTTHPLTHIYTHNVQTWIHLLLYPPGNDHHTVTLYPNGDHIHDPGIPSHVLPPRPPSAPTVAVQVCVPVHVPMVCTAAFFRGCM